MRKIRVYQSSLGSWFVTTTAPFHVLHIYPQEMWRQAADSAFEAAALEAMEATA